MTISKKSKRAEERARLFRAATMTLARLRARKAVEAQIRADGRKISEFTAAEIRERADDICANISNSRWAQSRRALRSRSLRVVQNC